MNKDIIRMAREAGFMVVADGDPEIGDWYECFTHEIERFAELVRADERKACAEIAAWILKMPQNDVSHHILTRGNK